MQLLAYQVSHARHLVFGLNQIGNQLLDPVGGASGERHRTGAGGSEHGQEAAAVDALVVRRPF